MEDNNTHYTRREETHNHVEENNWAASAYSIKSNRRRINKHEDNETT